MIPGAICIREDRRTIREDQKNCLFCREEMGNVVVKRGVMVKAGIPPSISEEIVRKVVQKTVLKWTHFQRKGILIKSELELRLKFEFARKVCHKHGLCKYEICNDQKAYGGTESRS